MSGHIIIPYYHIILSFHTITSYYHTILSRYRLVYDTFCTTVHSKPTYFKCFADLILRSCGKVNVYLMTFVVLIYNYNWAIFVPDNTSYTGPCKYQPTIQNNDKGKKRENHKD